MSSGGGFSQPSSLAQIRPEAQALHTLCPGAVLPWPHDAVFAAFSLQPFQNQATFRLASLEVDQTTSMVTIRIQSYRCSHYWRTLLHVKNARISLHRVRSKRFPSFLLHA
ncbi:hypothetical protein PsYK624_069670 [Phanerochaete sordida]|uniref:Uncharacterized protein n=1 Tax=Phanerochaete sordida TaxID=48140 RepID=A0A9P3LDW7_9APHY|nr:hypothetical protein PsYK624_069670 [Phanerochaete sordida]